MAQVWTRTPNWQWPARPTAAGGERGCTASFPARRSSIAMCSTASYCLPLTTTIVTRYSPARPATVPACAGRATNTLEHRDEDP